MSRRVVHVNTTKDVVWSADERKPIAALCGHTRIISERRLARGEAEGWPVCPKCNRIAEAMVSTGQLNYRTDRESIADMRDRLKREHTQWWTVTTYATTQWSFDPTEQ